MSTGRVSFAVNRPKNVLAGRSTSSSGDVRYDDDDNSSSESQPEDKVEYVTSVDTLGFKS